MTTSAKKTRQYRRIHIDLPETMPALLKDRDYGLDQDRRDINKDVIRCIQKGWIAANEMANRLDGKTQYEICMAFGDNWDLGQLVILIQEYRALMSHGVFVGGVPVVVHQEVVRPSVRQENGAPDNQESPAFAMPAPINNDSVSVVPSAVAREAKPRKKVSIPGLAGTSGSVSSSDD
jgi:hypothetical protein